MVEAGRSMPADIEKIFLSWRVQARNLRIIHVALLVSASAFSILTASSVSNNASPYFAVAAAVSVGILSALDLGVKANGFRNAWRHMNAAMARFQSIPEFTVEQLIQAYEDAEALIGDLPSGPRPEVRQGSTTDRPTGSRATGHDSTADGRHIEADRTMAARGDIRAALEH